MRTLILHPLCGSWAPKNFRSLVRGIIKKWIFFNILSRKLGKNVNLFHLKWTFLKVKQKKYHAFQCQGCGKWAARIKWAPNFKEIINGFLFSRNLIETFVKKGSFNTGGSINTAGSIYTGGSFSTSRLNFHIPNIKKHDTFSVWLKKKFMFRWKRFTFLPSLRESILKNIHFFIIPRTRERKFSEAQFPHPRCGNWAARIKRDSTPCTEFLIA